MGWITKFINKAGFVMKHVEGEVPFGDYLLWLLENSQLRAASAIALLPHQFDQRYLAWETVRLARNPFFENGTGFEGYWVGQSASAEETLQRLLDIGRDALESQARLYRYQYRFRQQLMKTLHGESADPATLAEWSNTLGAILGRLRCNIYRNPLADSFRRETYRQVEGLPPIRYHEVGEDLQQVYEIRDADHPPQPRLVVDPNHLRTTDQEAWQVAAALGKFGHPLVREVLLTKARL
jgi:hypothetical protein